MYVLLLGGSGYIGPPGLSGPKGSHTISVLMLQHYLCRHKR